jgi:hypothetical protein
LDLKAYSQEAIQLGGNERNHFLKSLFVDQKRLPAGGALVTVLCIHNGIYDSDLGVRG